LVNSPNTAFGDGFLAIITQTMIMVIFGMITMELIEQSYKLIYQLPNNIMRWIGGPQMGEDYGQMASAIKGAVSGAGGSLQSAGQGTLDNAGKAEEGLSKAYDLKKQEQAQDAGATEGGDVGGGGGGGKSDPDDIITNNSGNS